MMEMIQGWGFPKMEVPQNGSKWMLYKGTSHQNDGNDGKSMETTIAMMEHGKKVGIVGEKKTRETTMENLMEMITYCGWFRIPAPVYRW